MNGLGQTQGKGPAPVSDIDAGPFFSDFLIRFAVSVSGVQPGDMAAEKSGHHPLVTGRLEKIGVRLVDPAPGQRLGFFRHRHGSRQLDALFISFCLGEAIYDTHLTKKMLSGLRPGGRIVVVDFLKPDHPGFYCSDIRYWLHQAGFSNIIAGPVDTPAFGAGRQNVFMATATGNGLL